MSGTEASLVLGLISSIITIIQTTQQVYEAVEDAQGLPPNFRKSASKLPLISKLLEHAENYVETIVDEAKKIALKPALENCQLQATHLKQLFTKVMAEEDDSRWDRYVKAARIIGKGGRVEELVKGILDSGSSGEDDLGRDIFGDDDRDAICPKAFDSCWDGHS